VYGRGGFGGGVGIGPPVTPQIVKQLLIANLAVFVGQLLLPELLTFGAARPDLFWGHGWLWQPFTYMWLHSPGNIWHIAMNMFVLWMFGSPLALVWGARRFMRFYLICGVGAGLFIVTVPYLLLALGGNAASVAIPTVGASGAVYGVVLAYSLTWPDRTIMLIFPPVAFRAIWIIPVMFFLTLLGGGGNVSHVGHLGGVVVAWIYLRREGTGGRLLPTGNQLRYRLHRWRMRRRLRAVRREEEASSRQRRQDRTLH